MKKISTEASERPNSFDEKGGKVRIIPAEVTGYFRKRRDLVQAILVLFFLILPWTKINGLQTLQLDIVQRRFVILGVQFMSHDAPLVFFILGILTLSLALVTALWGRVWCGWACPQTVFIDGVYRRVEIWIEGQYIERRKLDREPLSFKKAWKLMFKWSVFFLISAIIAHSFIAYFAGAENLIQMMGKSPDDNWSYFVLVFSITGILTFNFGWFREQFCIVMCPYGRFQSVLMDANTVTVLYDEKRSDCVACQRCVQVCPTGIDIRHGVQMECIGCTACIDACDEIMRKVKKPEGLIRYASLRDKARLFRPRTIAYGAILILFAAALAFNLSHREAFTVSFVRGQDTPYQLVKTASGSNVINHFKIHIYNQTTSVLDFAVQLGSEELDKNIKLIVPADQLRVSAFESKEIHLFFDSPLLAFDEKGQLPVNVIIKAKDLEDKILRSVILVGPQVEKEEEDRE